jgi:protein-disulfide isomerase/uncharacterized membrane protein
MNKHEQPLRFLFYWIPVFILTTAGLIVSLYLSVSHYKVFTDIGYSSFCAISKAINCDTVSQSAYSILWGIPVPVWGVSGYVFLLLLLPYACKKNTDRKNIWPIFFVSVLFYSIYSLYLAYVSTVYIHSYCLMCLVTYGINFSLVFYSWIIIKRFNMEGVVKGIGQDVAFIRSNVKSMVPVLLMFSAALVILIFSFSDYWNLTMADMPTDIPTGVTEDGHPWIGAENPEITIIEYTDYLCFQCKKMHFYLRALIAQNANRIRLVHMHFPIDKKYNPLIQEDLHPGAGEMAMLAIYAGLKEKFWEMNDLLFQVDHSKGAIDLKEIAGKTKISINELGWALANKDIRLLLKRDIAFGIKAGVVGTPSYVIDGKTYQGNIPFDIIKNILKPKEAADD